MDSACHDAADRVLGTGSCETTLEGLRGGAEKPPRGNRAAKARRTPQAGGIQAFIPTRPVYLPPYFYFF